VTIRWELIGLRRFDNVTSRRHDNLSCRRSVWPKDYFLILLQREGVMSRHCMITSSHLHQSKLIADGTCRISLKDSGWPMAFANSSESREALCDFYKKQVLFRKHCVFCTCKNRSAASTSNRLLGSLGSAHSLLSVMLTLPPWAALYLRSYNLNALAWALMMLCATS